MLTAATESDARAIIAAFEARAQRHIALHQGRKVLWRRFGDGPALVLLHGGHGSGLHWIRNVDALCVGRTLWIPDMPGFGDSDSLAGDPHAPDRMARLVEAVSATMDSLVGATSEIHLAGFSFGGITAAFLAAARGHVRRLALLGAGAHGGRRRQTVALRNWRVPERDGMLAALSYNLVTFMLHDANKADALALAIHEWSCVYTRFRTKEIAATGGLPQALDRIASPTLLLWGEHDVTAEPEKIGSELTRGHANRRLQLVPDAGHWVQYEQPDAINALLSEWFAGGSASFAAP